MKTELIHFTGELNDVPVICIIGTDVLPPFPDLTAEEKDYTLKRLAEKKDIVFINSYVRYTVFVKADTSLPLFRQKEALRKAAAGLRDQIADTGFGKVAVMCHGVEADLSLAFAEGLMLSFYRFDKYRRHKPEEKSCPGEIIINADVDESEFLWVKTNCEAVYAVRDMINEPPLRMTAHALSEEIKRMGHSGGFRVEILDKNRIAALKMGGLLGVNSGSAEPPQFCIMEYKPENHINDKPVVLIGKGVVLDTGGLNIKTGNNMDMMKTDMAGGAAVAGAMYVIAKSALPLHVVALVPVTDNRPGNNAIAPGDIITMHNGTTVEVLNTDAEGRLILADAVSYSAKYDPLLVVTIATLTGSAALAFGNKATAMMGTAPEDYMNAMIKAGDDVYERIAIMPFWDEYSESLKSDVADIKNIGDREGGAIIAGRFISSFTSAHLIHLDIAGTGMLKKDDTYRTKEGPGTGVRLLAAFARDLTENLLKQK